MKAGLRFTMAYLAAGLAFAPAIARAQEVPAPTTNAPTTNAPATNTPATDAVGPRELQNFNLSGRVTRQADQPAVTQPAPAPRRAEPRPSAPPAASTSAPTRTVPSDQQRRTEVASTASAPPPAPSAEPQRQLPSSSVTVRLPQLDRADAGTAAPSAPAPGPAFAPDPQPTSLAPQQGFGLLPWLLAAIALGAGGAFLFWRNRSREAFAGGPQVDTFTTPEPVPVPVPAPRAAPPPASVPVPTGSIPGFVSTRLRPWIEIGFHPLRCIVDENQVVIEFEAELFNSGSAPARAVLAEAGLFNAGPAQDQELAAFFANPVGAGERIVEIGPLKRVALRSQVVTPLAQVQRYEMGGHDVFVPIIAFNALYRWSSGEGQTSVSYLLGRDAKDDKLGPFRLDVGPRVFRGLAARLLPTGLRQ